MAMRSLTCRFYLQELGREQDFTVPVPSDGQEGEGLQALVSSVFFNMEEKLFFALCTQLQYRVSLGSGQM